MADNYVILGQRADVQINPADIGFQDVWHITYRVTDGPSRGTTATVVVPDADHNATYVKQTIEDKIKQLDAIAAL